MTARSLFCFSTLSLIACLQAVAQSSAILRTANAIARELASTTENPSEFALSGTVTFVCQAPFHTFAIADTNGFLALIHDPMTSPCPRLHETITASGTIQTVTKYHDCRIAQCQTIEPKGTSRTCHPPLPVSVEQFNRGDVDYRIVKLRGTVKDACTDDIDPDWSYIILDIEGLSIYAAVPKSAADLKLPALIGAKIEIAGLCMPHPQGIRRFPKRILRLQDLSAVTIIRPAPADPFDVPGISREVLSAPPLIGKSGRLRVCGRVLASWSGKNILVTTTDGDIVGATLGDMKPPVCGTVVEIVGQPETDLYYIYLTQANWRPSSAAVPPEPPLQDVTIRDLLVNSGNRPEFKMNLHGAPVRITGTVGPISDFDIALGKIAIQDGGYTLYANLNAHPSLARQLESGSVVRLGGICVFETDRWRDSNPFPRIKSCMLVVRENDEIAVLKRPPWWTARTLYVVIGALLISLIALFIWIRMLNRIIERRSRQILRAQTRQELAEFKREERTRLAEELHDTFSQDLTGLAYQIDAAQIAVEQNPRMAADFLERTRRKMDSCRASLRNCLWDLRSQLLDEPTLANSLRQAIEPHLKNASLRIRCAIANKNLSESAAYSIICIVRELAINAVRHGRAGTVSITCERRPDNHIDIEVRDDGSGFDDSTRPGVDDGHFGLQGVRERADRLGGSVSITSAHGMGTVIRVAGLSGFTDCE